jgi:hypothetical protein
MKNGPVFIARHLLGDQLQELLVIVSIVAFLEFRSDLLHGGRVVS